MLANLFSLGIIGLQLCHPHLNIKSIYERYHKYGTINRLNLQSLNEHIANVPDVYLRAKIATLTNWNPETRRNVFQFIEKENIGMEMKANIVKRMLETENIVSHYGGPLSPLVKNTTPVRDGKALREVNQNLNVSSINRHQHLQKPKIE